MSSSGKSINLLAKVLLIMMMSWQEAFCLHYLFRDIDANNDEKIDMAEFSDEMIGYVFKKIDSDRNNDISESEWLNIRNVSLIDEHKKLFLAIDQDKGGNISFTEFSSFAVKNSNLEQTYTQLDRNQDGWLSPDEITVRPVFRMITIYFR